MDWGYVFFDPNGRISSNTYWIAVLILIVANIVVPMIPFLGWIGSAVLIWNGIAIYGKRLHDGGKSAWLHALPWGLNIMLMIAAFVLFGAGLINLVLETRDGADPSTATLATFFGSLGGAAIFLSVGSLIWLGYTIWVGVMEGDAGENQYGPPPA